MYMPKIFHICQRVAYKSGTSYRYATGKFCIQVHITCKVLISSHTVHQKSAGIAYVKIIHVFLIKSRDVSPSLGKMAKWRSRGWFPTWQNKWYGPDLPNDVCCKWWCHYCWKFNSSFERLYESRSGSLQKTIYPIYITYILTKNINTAHTLFSFPFHMSWAQIFNTFSMYTIGNFLSNIVHNFV